MASNAYHSYKTTIERGDIWYIESIHNEECSEQKAGRPAIVVSNDTGNKNGPIIEIVYLTTQPKNDMPTHVTIRSSTKPSVALCEQITTVAKSRLGDFVGKCTDDEMANIEIACAISLGIDMGVKPKAKVKEVIKEVPVPTDSSELIMVRAERDTYKAMYERLLDTVMKR